MIETPGASARRAASRCRSDGPDPSTPNRESSTRSTSSPRGPGPLAIPGAAAPTGEVVGDGQLVVPVPLEIEAVTVPDQRAERARRSSGRRATTSIGQDWPPTRSAEGQGSPSASSPSSSASRTAMASRGVQTWPKRGARAATARASSSSATSRAAGGARRRRTAPRRPRTRRPRRRGPEPRRRAARSRDDRGAGGGAAGSCRAASPVRDRPAGR